MELGSGVAIAGVVVAGGGVAITAIRSFAKDGKSNGHCADHSGMCQRVDGFESWLDKIESKLDRVIERRVNPRE